MGTNLRAEILAHVVRRRELIEKSTKMMEKSHVLVKQSHRLIHHARGHHMYSEHNSRKTNAVIPLNPSDDSVRLEK